ncbi:proteasome assembly chaperone family protein [Candidatus Woesearchaeota archaeon]|nr:proteasome assembly chaperone family protein [Candidatus Woesearchaeota archaeon]
MELNLLKRPEGPTIIQGFPGFGLVGTIATEFLIHHLKCEYIGNHWFENLPASIAVHEGKVVHPVGIYYNKDNNILVIHSITGGPGMEWEISKYVEEISKQLNAKEVISLEGVGTAEQKEQPDTFYYTNDDSKKEMLENSGLKLLSEGIVMGVTAALVLKTKIPLTALFIETHSELPDSKAAAELIKALDKILGLCVDPGPLYETAKIFEEKFNKLIEKGLTATEQLKKKQLNYVG